MCDFQTMNQMMSWLNRYISTHCWLFLTPANKLSFVSEILAKPCFSVFVVYGFDWTVWETAEPAGAAELLQRPECVGLRGCVPAAPHLRVPAAGEQLLFEFHRGRTLYQGVLSAGENFLTHTFVFPWGSLSPDVAVVLCSAQEVEPMSKESDHIHIIALAQALNVSILVEYMDRGEGGTVNHHVFPEGGDPRIFLLYRPGHYDILYK